MKMNKLSACVEAILFAAGEPMEIERIAEAMEESVDVIGMALENLTMSLESSGSGIKLLKMDNKYQLCTDLQYAQRVRAALEIKKNSPLSNAAFEVLAVIAYNQPVTKSFIEQVRGVDCSSVVQGLIAKGLVEERGRLELPGRPLVYGTTAEFLKCFCVSALDELPDLPEHEDMPKAEKLPNQLEINLDDGNIIENQMVTGDIIPVSEN